VKKPKINRRKFIEQASTITLASTLGSGILSQPALAGTSKTPYDFIMVEGHRDIYEFNDRFSAGETSPLVDSMLPRYLEGGINVVIMPVGGTHPALRGGNHNMLEGTLQTLDMILREIEKANGKADVIRSRKDIPKEPNLNKVMFFLDMEGAEPIQINPESGFVKDRRMALVRNFYRMGVRGIQLTHNERNYLADGIAMEGPGSGGLTAFGIEVIEEMNRLGMMIGVSHMAEEGIIQVAEISTAPIVSTHTNIRPFVDTSRQHTDAVVKAVAATGGLVGIRYILEGGKQTPYALLIDEIDHISDMVGVEHTGVGWYGHDVGDPRGGLGHTKIEMQSMYEQRNAFIQMLSDRGYSDDHIGLIVGGNFLRLWHKILKD